MEESTIILTVKVMPQSDRESIEPGTNTQLLVRVHAAPERGKANRALIALLADFLSIKKRDVQILSGETVRIKRVQVPRIESVLAALRGLSLLLF